MRAIEQRRLALLDWGFATRAFQIVPTAEARRIGVAVSRLPRSTFNFSK
jgi:hypothetical protein